MILKGFKEKSKKNYIKSQLKNRVIEQSNTKISRIGVLFSANEVTKIPEFKSLALHLGINKDDIEVVAFKPQVKEKEKENLFNPTYTLKNLGWSGTIKDKALQQFLNKDFDLLVSYYKKNETALKLITVASKAKFKVGILEADERINDLIIKTEVEDFKTFTSELKKYLKILNKI